jgi:hypothetical protein
MADMPPYPLPAGSRLLQDLGFLAFTLPEVAILMPTKKPRGQDLTREQQRATQALNQRWLRIEHVNKGVQHHRAQSAGGLGHSPPWLHQDPTTLAL